MFIIAAEDLTSSVINNLDYNSYAENILRQSCEYRIKYLEIDQLKSGWHTPLLPNHFRSGNGPLLAVEDGYNELQRGNYDIVVISGKDNLKSDYSVSERRSLMAIYAELSIPEAYTRLARLWCANHGVSDQEFIILSEKLFNNYTKTYAVNQGSNYNKQVDERWFNFVTSLFRGVDCANPVTDFSGRIVLTTSSMIAKLSLNKDSLIEIIGIANESVSPGPDGINEIAEFNHLATAYNRSCTNAGINFTRLFKQHKAFLEVYTCFPIIPLAFIYASTMARNPVDLIKLLEDYPITVNGGMNLAKGPWNLPVLRSIIVLYHKLLVRSDISYAGIHGNGGLGEKQGFLLLKKK